MSTAAMTVNICEHIKDNGFRCGTPAIRGRHFCYYHSRAHAPSGLGTRRYRAPIPETIESLQLTLLHITEALGSNTINEKLAGKLLYSVQLATNLLKMKVAERQTSEPEGAPFQPSVGLNGVVDETVTASASCHPERGRTSEPKDPFRADTSNAAPTLSNEAPQPLEAQMDNDQSPTANPPETRNLKLETELSPAMAAALAPRPVEPVDEPEPAPAPITRKEFDHLFERLMTDAQIRALRPTLGDGDANPDYNRATQLLTDHYNALQALADAGITEDDPRLEPYARPTPSAALAETSGE